MRIVILSTRDRAVQIAGVLFVLAAALLSIVTT